MNEPERLQGLEQNRQGLEQAVSEVERQAQELEEITTEVETLQLRVRALRAHNMHELAAVKAQVRATRIKLAHFEDRADLEPHA